MARWIAVPSPLAPRAGGVVRRKRVTARAGDRALAVWADRTLSEAVLLLGADDAVEILRARVVGTGGGVELQAWVLVAEGGEEVVQRVRVEGEGQVVPSGTHLELDSLRTHRTHDDIVVYRQPHGEHRMSSRLVSTLKGLFKQPERAGDVVTAGGAILEALQGAWEWVHDVRAQVNVLTWAEITTWFHDVEMPDDAECGAVLRRETPDGVEVVLVLLDADRNLVRNGTHGALIGLKLRASRLDEEAMAAFGGKKLVILN